LAEIVLLIDAGAQVEEKEKSGADYRGKKSTNTARPHTQAAN
jgi:hypothetical protein